MMNGRAHDEAMAELFQEDPAFATQYLNDILEEGDQADLLIALRQMATAFGGVPKVAEQAHLNPTPLYRTLSPADNPELRSPTAVLNHGHAPRRANASSGLISGSMGRTAAATLPGTMP